MPDLRRALFLVHRWLGVVMCAFFAMWFVSGVVMMYVGYPKLTESERLHRLPALRADAALLGPRAALDAAGIAGPLQSLRLSASSGGRAVYVAMAVSGKRSVVIDALTGAMLRGVDTARALASAEAFAGRGVAVRDLGTVGEDAFTHSRALDAHRPLHRLQFADADDTRVYVSGTTGEVVRDATATERRWNYAGAWIHWLYPFRGNVFDRAWSGIVEWLSIAGISLTLTGTVVGVMRWRFVGRYKSGARSPYRGFMMRWHHITGLLFALVTLTWIFSGLMSMNPWRIFDSGAPALRTSAMNFGPLTIGQADAAPSRLLGASEAGIGGVRELRWVRVAGRTLVQLVGDGGRPVLRDAASAAPATVDPSVLRAAVAQLMPEPVARIDVLQAYDTYYYDRDAHTMTGGTEKPLPVWRVVFADAHATWVHVDPQTGAVVGRTDSGRRASRWLFAMLHSWDWLPLLTRRPLWDAVMVLLSLGGAALSLTGVVVGWRRLGRKLR